MTMEMDTTTMCAIGLAWFLQAILIIVYSQFQNLKR
jgi:hypothetical protein